MKEDKWEYLVVFNWQTNTESGTGNQTVLSNKKFSTIDNIREMEKTILKENPDLLSVIITNFIILS